RDISPKIAPGWLIALTKTPSRSISTSPCLRTNNLPSLPPCGTSSWPAGYQSNLSHGCSPASAEVTVGSELILFPSSEQCEDLVEHLVVLVRLGLAAHIDEVRSRVVQPRRQRACDVPGNGGVGVEERSG